MDKSKRQALKEIKKRKLKDIAKIAAKKLAAVWVISSMLVVNVPTGFTMATFVDQEESKTNTMSAGTLDAQMTAIADFDPVVKPTINAVKDIDLSSLGTLGFKYNIKASNLIGDLCSNLNLKADLDGVNQYNGPIENFSIDIADFSAPEKWHFEASMETGDYSLQGKNCTLDFLVAAKQKDLISGTGFSDDEKLFNVINAGTWTLKGVWIQTTVDDFNAGVSSVDCHSKKEIAVNAPGDASVAVGGIVTPQTASFSGSNDGQHIPANAIDGNTGTYWKAVKAGDGDWFGVDYGQQYYLSKLEIDFHSPHIPHKYRIEISPTCAWNGEQTLVKSSSNNNSSFLTIEFTETSIKCARIVFLDTKGNAAIDEFTSFKRSTDCYDGKAVLTSQVFDSNKITKWTKLEWDELLQTGSDIKFSIRTSNDGSTWSAWQLQSGTSPIDLLSLPQTRYVQWQTELTYNTTTKLPPTLNEARVYYEQENAQNNIVMNEFLPNPDGTWGSDTSLRPQGEWIELYNKGTSKIDIAGFYFENSASARRTISTSRTNTGSTIIAPNDWIVVYTGQSGSPEFFNNAGDTIKFYDLFGNLLEQYSYDLTNACNLTPTPDNSNTATPSGSCTTVPGNKSYARIPDGTGVWVDPIPTPGSANIVEETFLEQLTETLTSTLPVTEQVAGEATTTPLEEIATTTETTTDPIIPTTTTQPVIEEATTTQEATTTETTTTSTAPIQEPATQEAPAETPISEAPADIPEEQPAIIPETPSETPVQPTVTETPVESPAPEAPAETAPETNSSTN